MEGCISKNELWIEKIARETKFEDFGEQVFNKKGLGPYLFFLVFPMLVLWIVIQGITFLRFGWFPSWPPYRAWAFPVGLGIGIWGLKKMRKKYYNVVGTLISSDLSSENKKEFFEILPRKLKNFLLISGFLMLTIAVFKSALPVLRNPSLIGEAWLGSPLATGYIIGSLNYSIWFLWVVVVAEFIAVFVGIHFFLPRKIQKSKIELDYSDPERYGGMKPVGSLIKFSSSLYFLALFIWTCTFLTTFLVMPEFEIVPFKTGITIFFSGAWIGGILLFLLPLFKINSHIRDRKMKKIRELKKKMRKDGTQNEGFLRAEPETLEETSKYIHRYIQFEHAHNLKEFPLNFTMIKEFVAIVIAPLGFHIITTFLIT